MKEDQKRSVAVMIGIAALLQIISQYIRYSQCADLGGGNSTCFYHIVDLNYLKFGNIYSFLGLLLVVLLIIIFFLSFKYSSVFSKSSSLNSESDIYILYIIFNLIYHTYEILYLNFVDYILMEIFYF